MTSIQVEPVTDRKRRRHFLSLPARLYAASPHWVCPLASHAREMAGFARHPFYDDAESQAFVAYQESQPAGRILAIINHAHNRSYPDQPCGFLGFFEAIDRPDVATALFEAGHNWCRERGFAVVRGPVSPSMNYECGLLVDGFDTPSSFMMPYSQPYYGQLWESAGFEKVQDTFAFRADTSMIQSMDQKMRYMYHEIVGRFDVRLRGVDRRQFQQDVRTFLSLYNAASAGTWGFVPLSPAEIEHLSGTLKHLIIPELTSIAEIDGKVVGAVFGLLDYNPIIRKIRGKLFPFGFARLLLDRNKMTRSRIMSINVLPEYQRFGVGVVLIGSLMPKGVQWGLQQVEFSYVLESNALARKTLERGGAIRSQTFRIYERH